ncbi:hypothetical protein CTI12_AA450390 [Artemisia annua]|uniref:Uncharacterized protein n=1 Tax=Artemisia annua TaxID=35608 RepID=A0A2U1LVE5_ARTAN|nr:hypothetical protein CTI12_AA450390 [Artemisia annua]
MDNMNSTYTPSSSKITMTPEAIKKLVNNIVSVVLEGTTIVYPRRETGIPGQPTLKLQKEGLTLPSPITKGLGKELYLMEITKSENSLKEKPSTPPTTISPMLKTAIINI